MNRKYQQKTCEFAKGATKARSEAEAMKIVSNPTNVCGKPATHWATSTPYMTVFTDTSSTDSDFPLCDEHWREMLNAEKRDAIDRMGEEEDE